MKPVPRKKENQELCVTEFYKLNYFFCSYERMRECWDVEPENRPTFSQLAADISISCSGHSELHVGRCSHWGRTLTLECTHFLSSDIWRKVRGWTNLSMKLVLRKSENQELCVTEFYKLNSFICSYEMMIECWDVEPENRPTFSQLVADISTTLEDRCLDI